MSKLAPSQYVKAVAVALTNAYGSTLREGDTDIAMARAAVRKLKPFLSFRKETAETRREFREWKDKAENR